MDVDNLREELEALEWNQLRNKAKVEYDIKLLPEHTRIDVTNLILQKANGSRAAPAVELPREGEKVRPGHARITLLPVPGEPDPFYVCINGWPATIPRGIEVEVPHEILPSLDSMSCDFMAPDGGGIMRRVRHKRAPYQVHEIDKSVSSGKLPFTGMREKQIADKRAYDKAYGRWPTDTDMRDFMRSGGAEILRKLKEEERLASPAT